MLDMEDISLLLNFTKNVKVADIEKFTGIDQSMIYKLRRGERKIGNLTISTGRKLEKCYNFYERQNVLSDNSDEVEVAINNAKKVGIIYKI
ncbi:hypothetical protein [Staphylococcus hominis]|uniref:hypothetical protein n=1 Tax=Staphylococcus hominis TaxID=1290 RepID=UPI000E6A8B85|nr:hypothetical protein [Staphylococcus hominis]RIO56437.1 hypothetical protein BUZ49_11215 [Staphylococcus hominis]